MADGRPFLAAMARSSRSFFFWMNFRILHAKWKLGITFPPVDLSDLYACKTARPSINLDGS
jgi:hypothetical protein